MSHDFEAQVRAALRAGNPPPGFAERVIAKAEPRRAPNRGWAMWAVAAALVAGVFFYQDYRERQAEEAGRKTMAALRITAEKLQRLQSKLVHREVERENP